MLLEGKAGVVTGSGQGIGRAVVKAMALEGASVIVNDVNAENVAQVVAEIEAAGGKAKGIVASVAEMAGAREIIDGCVSQFGKIDFLVNNAGILRDRMVFNMSEEEWDAVIAVHLKGTFGCTHYACRYMKAQQSGHIINTTSRSGLRGRIGQANYSAAKAGLVGFTLAVAQEMKRYGVTCNAICPRAETGMTATIPEEMRKARDAAWQGTGVRLRGGPEDIAPVAIFLASDEAAGITGQIVGIGGDKLSLWSHHKEIRETFMPGGWTAEKVKSLFRTTVGYQLEVIDLAD